MRTIILAALIAIATPLYAELEFPADYTRVLLPVVLSTPFYGAFNSNWTTRVTLLNTGLTPLSVLGYDPNEGGCRVSGCPPMPDTPAGVTLFPVVSVTSFFANGPGAFLYVQKDRALDAHIGLRVQELSRQAGTWGTELPVVREGDFYERTFELSDVPISAGFRSLLRVYSLSPAFGESVRMRVYAINPDRHYLSPAPAMDTLLVDELIQLSGGYRQISLDSTPGIQSGDVVRIEIDPVASNSAIWAFVSVTNNETEQVTTITPR